METEVSPDIQAHRDWLLSFVDLPEDGVFLDLGCGSGKDLLTLARRNPGVRCRFLGLDTSEKAVAAARVQTKSDPRIMITQHHFQGQIPLGDASADVVYSHNLLECLAQPSAFAQEIARVLRPGGTAVIAHWDFDSQLLDASDRSLVRRMVHAFCDWKQPWMEHSDGWMGRRLWGVFAPTELFEGSVHARVLINTIYGPGHYGYERVQDLGRMVNRGLVREEEYQALVTHLERFARENRYFYSITGYVYVGRRRAAST